MSRINILIHLVLLVVWLAAGFAVGWNLGLAVLCINSIEIVLLRLQLLRLKS